MTEIQLIIKCKRNIYPGMYTPQQEIYNDLRNAGFYDIHIEEVKE